MAYLSCAKDNEYPLLLIFNLLPVECFPIILCLHPITVVYMQ